MILKAPCIIDFIGANGLRGPVDRCCAADFALLNLPKGKSLGRSKPATSSYAQAPQHTVWDDSYYIQALLNCLL